MEDSGSVDVTFINVHDSPPLHSILTAECAEMLMAANWQDAYPLHSISTELLVMIVV